MDDENDIFGIVMLISHQVLPKINTKEKFKTFYDSVRDNGELTQEEIDSFFFSWEYFYSVVKNSEDISTITKDDYDKGYIYWERKNKISSVVDDNEG
jgi:hypothetical protein